jgi:hypothetical protein
VKIPVGIPGFEPGTSSLSVKRSNQLSYTPARPDKRLSHLDRLFKSCFFPQPLLTERAVKR